MGTWLVLLIVGFILAVRASVADGEEAADEATDDIEGDRFDVKTVDVFMALSELSESIMLRLVVAVVAAVTANDAAAVVNIEDRLTSVEGMVASVANDVPPLLEPSLVSFVAKEL